MVTSQVIQTPIRGGPSKFLELEDCLDLGTQVVASHRLQLQFCDQDADLGRERRLCTMLLTSSGVAFCRLPLLRCISGRSQLLLLKKD